MADIKLIVSGEGADERSINTQSEALRAMLERELEDGEVKAAEPGESVPGAKGDPITIGTIALALVTSGSVVALINCFRAIFARDKTLNIKVKDSKGGEIEVNSKNVNNEEILKGLQQLVDKRTP